MIQLTGKKNGTILKILPLISCTLHRNTLFRECIFRRNISQRRSSQNSFSKDGRCGRIDKSLSKWITCNRNRHSGPGTIRLDFNVEQTVPQLTIPQKIET